MTQKVFVDDNGIIYTVFKDDTSNFPGDLRVSMDLQEVDILGEYIYDPSGREITATYTLHESLTALANLIEPELA